MLSFVPSVGTIIFIVSSPFAIPSSLSYLYVRLPFITLEAVEISFTVLPFTLIVLCSPALIVPMFCEAVLLVNIILSPPSKDTRAEFMSF